MNKWLMIIGLLILPGQLIFARPEKFLKELLTTTPSRLQLFVNQKNDPYTIKVAYTLNVPSDYIRSCARLVYKPYFLAPDHRYDLTPLVISGQQNLREERRLEILTGKQPEYPDAMHLESNGDGMKISLSEIVPFQAWMAQSKLRADVVLESCDREKHMEVLTLAEGVIWFPMEPGPALVKYVKEVAEVPETSGYYFIYPSGQYLFNREYNGNAGRMQEMMQLMDSLPDRPDMKLKKIVITGYCSPDGIWNRNEWLARERALQMKQWFTGQRGLNPELIEVKTVPQDWQGLRELIRKDTVITGKKNILNILNGHYTDEQRLQLLRKWSQYEYIRLHLFPELQKVICQFYYTRQKEVTKIVPL